MRPAFSAKALNGTKKVYAGQHGETMWRLCVVGLFSGSLGYLKHEMRQITFSFCTFGSLWNPLNASCDDLCFVRSYLLAMIPTV